MAIQLALSTPFGIDLPGAYIKIVHFSGDNKYVQYVARTWATPQARADDRREMNEGTFSFEYVPGQGDVLVACYNDLMSRPEFAGAIAV